MTAPRRVLIAEDEALIRLDLAEMLSEEGFEVVGQAVDGEQAVALATELRPDLVILDVKMPKKDGIDAAGEIVAEQIAPVVILTAFSQRDLIERARDAGAMAYLVKPFSKADLLPAIELAVARYAETAALRARGRRHQSAARGAQGHRPRQGPADDPPEDDRAGGVPLDPAHRDGSPDLDAGRRRRGAGGSVGQELTGRSRRDLASGAIAGRFRQEPENSSAGHSPATGGTAVCQQLRR